MLNFVPAPNAPNRGELPVLVIDKAGRLAESWHTWSKMGVVYAQLTNKSVVEVVGWTSIQKRVNYATEKDFNSSEENPRDYIPWDQIPTAAKRKNKKRKSKRKNVGGNRSTDKVQSISSGLEKNKS
jgi:hypothetical protein